MISGKVFLIYRSVDEICSLLLKRSWCSAFSRYFHFEKQSAIFCSAKHANTQCLEFRNSLGKRNSMISIYICALIYLILCSNNLFFLYMNIMGSIPGRGNNIFLFLRSDKQAKGNRSRFPANFKFRN